MIHSPAGIDDVDRRRTRGRTLELAWILARSDLKQRYYGTVFGALWTTVRPLLLFAVLFVVFTHIVRVGGDIPEYPLYLLIALSIWGVFSELTRACLGCLVSNASILKKIRVPLMAIPLSLVITSCIQAMSSLAVLLVFLVGSGIEPQIGWLLLPVGFALTIVVSWGVGLALSVCYVWFRDLEPIWDVFSQLLFWATPVIYVSSFPSRPLRDILGLNPLSPLITQLRRVMIDPGAPTVFDVFSPWALGVSISFAVFSVLAGTLLFDKLSRKAIEHL